jgi:hypothetical protein
MILRAASFAWRRSAGRVREELLSATSSSNPSQAVSKHSWRMLSVVVRIPASDEQVRNGWATDGNEVDTERDCAVSEQR